MPRAHWGADIYGEIEVGVDIAIQIFIHAPKALQYMKNKEMVVEQLNRIAKIFEPFTRGASSGSLIWNESEYQTASEEQAAEPNARQWYGTLTIAAGILERQSSSLSGSQIEYLKKTLVGGMGSLQDLTLDEDRFGSRAAAANEKLRFECNKLFEMLVRILPSAEIC